MRASGTIRTTSTRRRGRSTTPAATRATSKAGTNAYEFSNVAPRVGITYALDHSRKTVARGSYAMFASQLPGTAAAFISPIQPYTYIYYNAVDRNGNRVADLNEIDFAAGVRGSNNVDLAHPGVASTTNTIGAIRAPRTQEMLFGIDRELMPNFGASATVTYRYMDNFLWNPRNGVTPASYVQSGTFTGTFESLGTVSVPLYSALSAQPGYHAEHRPDYHRRYLGFELSLIKRMSNRWMGRAAGASTPAIRSCRTNRCCSSERSTTSACNASARWMRGWRRSSSSIASVLRSTSTSSICSTARPSFSASSTRA